MSLLSSSIVMNEDAYRVLKEKGRPALEGIPRVFCEFLEYFHSLRPPIMLTSILVRGENGIGQGC